MRIARAARWAGCLGLLLTLNASVARADVALLVHEAIGVESEIYGAGHAAIYLSAICSDDARTLRPCRDGEEGVVVSTYPDFVQHDAPYWMAMPLSYYLFGTADPDQAPLYSNRQALAFVRSEFGRRHAGLLPDALDDGGRPIGTWPLLVGNALQRSIYALTLHTSPAEDARVMAVLNSLQGRRAFDLSYNNCSDFSRYILNTYFPGAVHRDGWNDFSFTTPKAIAHTLTKYGKRHPELGFHVVRYRQVEGPMGRSRPNRSLSEKMVTSRKYLAASLLLNPIATAALGALYGATGVFSVERTFSHRTPRGSSPLTRESVRKRLDALLQEAVERRLVRDRREAVNFLATLDAVSAPEYGDRGLQLRVGVEGQTRIVGLTKQGLLDDGTDPRLAYLLMLSVTDRSIRRSGSHRPTFEELERNMELLDTLRNRPGVWTSPSGSPECPTNSTCAPTPRAPLWKRVLIQATH